MFSLIIQFLSMVVFKNKTILKYSLSNLTIFWSVAFNRERKIEATNRLPRLDYMQISIIQSVKIRLDMMKKY